MAVDKIPDYQVEAFLNACAPGKKNTEIADILYVGRKQVTVWKASGMPLNKARELVAWAQTEALKKQAALWNMVEEYGL